MVVRSGIGYFCMFTSMSLVGWQSTGHSHYPGFSHLRTEPFRAFCKGCHLCCLPVKVQDAVIRSKCPTAREPNGLWAVKEGGPRRRTHTSAAAAVRRIQGSRGPRRVNDAKLGEEASNKAPSDPKSLASLGIQRRGHSQVDNCHPFIFARAAW